MILLVVSVTAALAISMAGAWALQRATHNCGWVDVVWTLAVGVAGVAYALIPVAGVARGPRALLVVTLIAVWSVRLGGHLALRTVTAPAEDARYARFRQEWGRAFDARLFVLLQIQALAAAVLALAVLVAARNPSPGIGVRDLAGAALFFTAIFGEALADRQLRRFKAYPPNRGAICDVGLWSWSRHPNYVFEWLAWLAFPLMAIDLSGAWPWGWLALAAPFLMFVLLRYVSGVPPTEAAMAQSRGAAFARYQARVSIFLPLPPRPTPEAVQDQGERADHRGVLR